MFPVKVRSLSIFERKQTKRNFSVMAQFAIKNAAALKINVEDDATMHISSPRKRKATQTFCADINAAAAKRHSPWHEGRGEHSFNDRKLSLRSASKFRPISEPNEETNEKKKENQRCVNNLQPETKNSSTGKKEKGVVGGIVPEGVASEDDVVTVLASDAIQPSKEPAEEMQNSLKRLNSAQWSVSFVAVESIRRMAIHHSASLIPHLKVALKRVLECSTNLRSAVAKNALFALDDIIRNVKEEILFKTVDNEGRKRGPTALDEPPLVDQLVATLINTTASDKKFLRDNSNRALFSLISCVPHKDVLSALLKCANHKRSKVRGRVAIFVEKCLGHMGSDKVKEIFLTGVTSPQRLQIIIKKLSKLFNGHVQDSRMGAAGALKHLFVAVGSVHFNSTLGQMLHPVETKRIQSSIQRLVLRDQSKSNLNCNTKTKRLSLKEKIKQRKKLMMKQEQNNVASEAFSCVVLSKPKP